MPRIKHKPEVLPGWVSSRHTYKKLGTIVEHLIDCVNPFLYEVRVTSYPQANIIVIRIYPIPVINQMNMFPNPVWELSWNIYFNSKIHIDQSLLIPTAEW